MSLVIPCQSCWSPCGPPHTVALCSQRAKLELQFPNLPNLLSWQVLCLAPWHRMTVAGMLFVCSMPSQSRLSPLLEQEFRLGHQCQMRSQGVLPIRGMLKGNLISLTCSSRLCIKVTFHSLTFHYSFEHIQWDVALVINKSRSSCLLGSQAATWCLTGETALSGSLS